MADIQRPRAFLGRAEHTLILSLKGSIRYATAQALKEFLERTRETSAQDTTILDLRELELIDSTGMGLLARLGRDSLERGRRSVIVCSNQDVLMCLHSAAFDTLFLMLEDWPLDTPVELAEIPMGEAELVPDLLGHIMLDAHRDLASLSEQNQLSFGPVVATLEDQLCDVNPAHHQPDP